MPAEHAIRRTGTVMGTRYAIVGHAVDAPLFAEAARELARLECRWSRFLPDSEIAVLNRTPGRPVIVADETFAVISAAVDGAIATGGLFDPTVHDTLVAHGYDRSFAEITTDGDDTTDVTIPFPPAAAPGVAGITLDEALRAVTLPPGVRLDLGGIGKGAAADRVSGQLIDRGARGVAIVIGGDARVRGRSPDGGGWRPVHEGEAMAGGAIHDGGVCTSSIGRRRWVRAGRERNHLVDPRTGRCLGSAIASVTVTAATATQAEVLAKAAMVRGSDAEGYLRSFGVHATVRRAAPAA